jgi:hypothetical protein
VFFLSATAVLGQQSSVGAFADQSDVGNPLRTGRATYDADNQEYTIEGAGRICGPAGMNSISFGGV